MHFSLSGNGRPGSLLEQDQSRASKTWPRWIQSAAALLTESLSQNDPEKSHQFCGRDEKDSNREVKGQLSGEIYYVSPSLNSISNGERIITLPTSIRKTANELIESERELKKYGARAVELMCSIRPSKAEILSSEREKDLEISTIDDFEAKKYYGSRDMANEKLAEMPTRKEIRILSIISEQVRNYPIHKDAVIFFEEDGMVGLAPAGTRVGDYICRIENSGVATIVREHEGGFWMIARAMQLSPLAKSDISLAIVVCDIDIEDLELLRRTSTYGGVVATVGLGNEHVLFVAGGYREHALARGVGLTKEVGRWEGSNE